LCFVLPDLIGQYWLINSFFKPQDSFRTHHPVANSCTGSSLACWPSITVSSDVQLPGTFVLDVTSSFSCLSSSISATFPSALRLLALLFKTNNITDTPAQTSGTITPMHICPVVLNLPPPPWYDWLLTLVLVALALG
jgi:hypothetical protein